MRSISTISISQNSEVTICRCFPKQVLLKFLQNSQEKPASESFFWWRCRTSACNFMKKDSGSGVFQWIFWIWSTSEPMLLCKKRFILKPSSHLAIIGDIWRSFLYDNFSVSSVKVSDVRYRQWRHSVLLLTLNLFHTFFLIFILLTLNK